MEWKGIDPKPSGALLSATIVHSALSTVVVILPFVCLTTRNILTRATACRTRDFTTVNKDRYHGLDGADG